MVKHRLLKRPAFTTRGTQSFQHVIHTAQRETIGQRHHGYGYMFQTKGAMALRTVEMGMFKLHTAIAIIGTNSIFQRPRPVVDGMYEPVEQE